MAVKKHTEVLDLTSEELSMYSLSFAYNIHDQHSSAGLANHTNSTVRFRMVAVFVH